MQSLCYRVGLMVVFDVFSTAEACIQFLNANRYDIVFIHQLLLFGPSGDSLLLNFRCLLSCTPVVVMGLCVNFHLFTLGAATMEPSCPCAIFPPFFVFPLVSQTSSTTFWSTSSSPSSPVFSASLCRKCRKSSDCVSKVCVVSPSHPVMEHLSAGPTKSDYKLVGIPIPLGREVFCLPFTNSGSSYHRRGLS